MTQPYYPNLDGKVNYDVAQGIRTAYDFIHQLTARLDKIERGNYVTRDQALTHLGPSSLRKQLQVTGSAPLNVTGLAGQLAQPQIADAQRVTALPPITDPLSQDGTLVSLSDQVYRFDGTTDPGTWKPITAGPAPGTAVTSLDTLTGPVTLVAGSNITISDNVPLAGDITISASGAGGSGGGSGFPGIDGLDGEDAFAIPGAQGPQGNPGATGPQGPAGLGLDGLDADEPMMIPGVAGPAGATGATGATGPAGPIGLGIDGLDGEEGMAIPGPQGPAGSGGGGASLIGVITPNPLTPPVIASFTWVNQGSAAATANSGGAVWMNSGPATGTTSLTILVKSTPAAPWSAVLGYTENTTQVGNNVEAYLFLRESSTGKLITVGRDISAGSPRNILAKWTNETTFSAVYYSVSIPFDNPIIWFKVTDDGTNLTFFSGPDGQNWLQEFQVSRTNWMATGPNQAGFGVNKQWLSGGLFLHWSLG